jgi:proteasome-associated ATPase
MTDRNNPVLVPVARPERGRDDDDPNDPREDRPGRTCGAEDGVFPNDRGDYAEDDGAEAPDERRVADLRKALEKAQSVIADQGEQLKQLLTAPLIHASVVRAGNEINPEVFEENDKVIIIDRESRYFGQLGRIVHDRDRRPQPQADENAENENAEAVDVEVVEDRPVSEDGLVKIELTNGLKRTFQIGLHNAVDAQVKLLRKDDGTNVLVSVSGDHFEVFGVPGMSFYPGEKVKVDMKTKAIIDKVDLDHVGEVACIKNVLDEETYVIEIGGQERVVLAGPTKPVELDNEGNEVETKAEEGDMVLLDRAGTVVVRHLPRTGADRHTLDSEIDVSFEDIAGLNEAKEAVREAIEYPILHKDIYEFFKKTPPKGMLFYGPPGCGKTLLGKAMTKLLSNVHGVDAVESGFIYVKGPELLDKWVGSTERQIRELFIRAAKHYEKFKYPAILFIDEADAILPERGTRKSSDVDNTIVPMFLSEMDGLTENHCVVVLSTNRPNQLDPAAIRDGRCDRHIKISRPTINEAPEYFIIHLRGIPLDIEMPGKDPIAAAAAFGTAEIFSKQRTLYKITHGAETAIFCFGDAVNGAMIKGIVDEATTIAMHRNMEREEGQAMSGVSIVDLRSAVENVYKQHLDLNHNFDVEDFCEKNKINRQEAQVVKHAGEY